MRQKTVRFGGMAVVLAAALVLAACGDDDDDDAEGGSTGPAMTGAPIELGLSNTENSPAGNYVDYRKGFEAAVEYVNTELGGVNGRPLRLEPCATNGSPETAIACANKFVQAEKLAVLPGIDLSAPGAMPIYSQAGMPYVGGLPASADEFTAPTAYSFTGATPGAIAAGATYAVEELQAKKVVYLSHDVPQASAGADLFIAPIVTKAGGSLEKALESPTAADFTPVMTKAVNANPDAIIMGLAGPTCVKAMQALTQVNFPKEKVIFLESCANKDQIAAGGSGGSGAIYQSPFLNPDSDHPNVQIFRESMERYSDVPASLSTAVGFDTIMNLYALLKKMDPNGISSENLIAALKATDNEPGFLSHGYTCNGQQFPGLSALCDANERFLKEDNGKFVETNNEWINGATLLTAGG